MAHHPSFDDVESDHLRTSTGRVLDELALYGCAPPEGETDPRPEPDPDRAAGALADIFDALISTLTGSNLEPELPDLLWSTVNLFHRASDRLQRRLDDNEDAQRQSQRAQDGSEVQSVELERLVATGRNLLDRRDGLEMLRDGAADLFRRHTGDPWSPRTGSRINHRRLTATLIDSRDHLAARRRVEALPLLPPGPKIAFTGGAGFNDHKRIWAALDKVHAKHPDMVLVHGGAPTGAERIAACWAESRHVPHIAYKPDWARYARAAPFKRNDAILELPPIGLLAFPGTGINANLVDKARQMGLPVWRFEDDA